MLALRSSKICRHNSSTAGKDPVPPKPKKQKYEKDKVASNQPPVTFLDHQTIGQQRELFKPTEYSPGSPLFLPKGAAIFNKLVDFLRLQYEHYGYEEVITPLLYKKALWEKSGHWAQYKDDMYTLGCEHHPHSSLPTNSSASNIAPNTHTSTTDDIFGLKPMNCPGHCLLYQQHPRSYRELPIRYAEFSPLHRNEPSGTLTGLTRVRRFHQDDAHIFCRPDQIGPEVRTSLEFTRSVYRTFHLPAPRFVLSTRPETGYIGTREEWDSAEEALKTVMDGELGKGGWRLNEGDGAFYGPKIDVLMPDRAGREHQVGTIQLDLQLPQRFDLRYIPASAGESDATTTSTDIHQPVLIHRAIFGSLERFLALLTEHYQPHWPLWLSPNPFIILPIHTRSPALLAHVDRIRTAIQYRDPPPPAAEEQTESPDPDPLLAMRARARRQLRVDVDLDPKTGLAAKLARAAREGYNLVVLVGDREVQSGETVLDYTGQGYGLRDGEEEEEEERDRVGQDGARLESGASGTAGGAFGEEAYAGRTVTRAGRRQVRLGVGKLREVVMGLLAAKC